MRLTFPVTMFAILMLHAGALQAERTSVSSIVVHSPFLPPNFNPPGGAGQEAGAPATESQFQFKGVYQLDGEYYFHIYDQRSRKGSWIGSDTGATGYPRVIQFQESMNRLIVELNGERLQLQMSEPASQPVSLSNDRSPQSEEQSPVSSVRFDSDGFASRRPVIRSTSDAPVRAPVRRVTFSPRQNNN